MKHLTFPGLGLAFDMDPIAFTVFNWPIHWYGVIIAVGFMLAVWYGVGRGRGFGVDEDKLTDAVIIVVPCAIIGTRAYYVIFNMGLYIDPDGTFNWGRAIALWDGGLAIYGGIIATVIAGVIYCAARKQNFWDYMDCTAFGLLIGQSIGRWGNFVNVEAFGSVTDVPWRMAGPDVASYLLWTGQIDAAGYDQIVEGTLGVHPTFLYESLWNLLGLILLILYVKKLGRKFSGQPFLLYVIWYGLGRAAIEGLRTDSLYFFGTGIRTSQMVGLASAAAAALFMGYRLRTAGPPTPPFEPAAAAPASAEPEQPAEPETPDAPDETKE